MIYIHYTEIGIIRARDIPGLAAHGIRKPDKPITIMGLFCNTASIPSTLIYRISLTLCRNFKKRFLRPLSEKYYNEHGHNLSGFRAICILNVARIEGV
jgi:hypothetical protein